MCHQVARACFSAEQLPRITHSIGGGADPQDLDEAERRSLAGERDTGRGPLSYQGDLDSGAGLAGIDVEPNLDPGDEIRADLAAVDLGREITHNARTPGVPEENVSGLRAARVFLHANSITKP
uniref:hypothetical protein n=1 Tax=Rhodococcus qingshengii TaxID=334542 RepID=UPI001C4E0F31|nr:hypothetical protein [Rhodococcus qingshengii]